MDSDHDWKSPKFQAALSTMVKNARDRLTDNRSNYANWEYRVKHLIKTMTSCDNYLDNETTYARDPQGDRIVFSIIDLLVPTDVGRRLSRSARSAMAMIRAMFFFPSRSTHITMWKEALDTKLTDGMDIGTYLRRVEAKVLDLDHTGFAWSKDGVLGALYQLGLGSGYANVSTVLNAQLRAHPDRPVSAQEVEEAICAESQECVSNTGTADLPTFGALDLNAMTTAVPGHSHTLSRGTYHPLIRGSMMRGAINTAKIFVLDGPIRCSITPRYAMQCHRPPGPPSVPYQLVSHPTYATRPLCDLHHCLGCGEYRHWLRTCPYYRDTPRPGPPSQTMRLNLADANGEEFTAEVMVPTDQGPLPEDIWASETDLMEVWEHPDEGVSDTGATHMVTGNLENLMDVHALTRPIPISVATRGPKAFVTHRGTLHLQ
ncbi:hypothetical protein CROQUDRAFT_47675, partial [Cronartium quercuum f. sp. fusiforme G11]